MRKFERVAEGFEKHPMQPTYLPTRADGGSAGYDFHSKETMGIMPGQAVMFWSDVKVKMNVNEVLMIYPRSSFGKLNIMLANTTGVIDRSYYSNPSNDGNIGIMLYNYGNEPVIINVGDRIAQGVFIEYKVTYDDVPENDFRIGGYGSTGK